jgi:hypothetical protein
MKRIKIVVGRFTFGALLCLGPLCPLHAALTRLEVSSYNDYAVRVSLGDQTEKVYASVLTASYLPGPRNGADSAPLPAGYPASFTAFSLDLPSDLVSKSYWEQESLPSGNADRSQEHQSPLWNPGGIYRAASLYDAYVGEVNTSTAAGRLAGAALQLAIWDVLYGDALAVNHPGSGFYVNDAHGHESQSQLVFAANAMLASAANSINLNAQATFWDAVLGPNGRGPLPDNQDLLGPGITSTGVVPEASAWLAAAGAVAGLTLLRNSRWGRNKVG